MTQPPKIEIDTRFDHAAASVKWYARWESSGAFRADPLSGKPPFVMVIPPPNVTGALHMGHALNNTIQDVYARYHRMKGYDVAWIPGTDHAGIATQNVVEKMLAKEGKSRHDLGREEFLKRVWKWKAESGGTIVNQLRRLGASCDWERERFTMDEGLTEAVTRVFVTLHGEGLIYRADRLVNWCTRCHTALSDIEVEHEDKKGAFWHVRYLFADGSGEIVIATTRPETMLGDTAVAVHPDDERYRDLVGRELILPVVGRRIPLIADAYVDKTFGTGALKITPAHDPNDYEVGLRHSLPVIKAFTESGKISDEIGLYSGMTILACRNAIVADLEREELLVKVDETVHSVGHCYRCKTVIEPYLTPQWFVKTKPLAEPAIKAVEEGRTKIYPETWERTYFEWMNNIRDWCISRQIWWGHRIPAWYCLSCDRENILGEGDHRTMLRDARPIVSHDRPKACPHCGGSDLIRDPDVLDTWFSSALWPFSTLGWPEETKELKRYYPTNLLVTGFDIIFFWVARMMMMGLRFMNEVPFREVYIHALVRDSEGKKMSKSRGNVIDPLSVIDDLGADAFRFTLAAFCAQGRDVKLDAARIEGYRNFVTKVWNAGRLILTYEAGEQGVDAAEDRWIKSRLARATQSVSEALEGFHLDRAANAVYAFFWHEFCDWYLEIAKPRFRAGDTAALSTAAEVYRTSLLLLHPFMPFVTDELDERLGGRGFLDQAGFPEAGEIFPEDERRIETMIAVISEIRKMRAEFKIAPSEKIGVVLVGDVVGAECIRNLANVEIASKGEIRHYAGSVVDGVEIILPLEGVIDLAKEKVRLSGEIEKCDDAIAASERRLSNEEFVANAPSEVVEASRETLRERCGRREKLRELLANL